jgi:signal transduction histidine kinase
MTQRKKEEASLLNSSKMSALGEMASGIAHEVNNPLTVIRGNTMMMKYLTKSLPDREKLEQILDTNLSSIDKAARIIWGLQRFAKDGSKDPFEKKNLLELVQDVVGFSEARMKNEGIHFDLKIPENIVIECQVIQLQQVFLNLINNSIYELQHSDHRRKVIRIEASLSENELFITLTDSGRGIPEELQSKLMQPFFTTKPLGEGAGLGLSTSRGIMESHHGSLNLNPSYKEGAQFLMRLPLNKKAA